jgi:hypothetical protein
MRSLFKVDRIVRWQHSILSVCGGGDSGCIINVVVDPGVGIQV